MEGKIIFGLILTFFATMSQAQENGKYIPPDMTPIKHSFVLPELQVDSAFIECLDTILFDKKCRWRDLEDISSKSWRNFYIDFEKKDSLNYNIWIELWDTPTKNSTGFFEHNGYFYWFGDDAPENIVLKTKSKKQFSHTEYPLVIVDPVASWILMYNIGTGIIEIKERYGCD